MKTKAIKHSQYETGEWRQEEAETCNITIYCGGDIQIAERICREACYPKGLCVTLEPTNYIFAGGTEAGFKVGLINYPPFPTTGVTLLQKAVDLGKKLQEANYQWSFTIVTQHTTYFFSRRTK